MLIHKPKDSLQALHALQADEDAPGWQGATGLPRITLSRSNKERE